MRVEPAVRIVTLTEVTFPRGEGTQADPVRTVVKYFEGSKLLAEMDSQFGISIVPFLDQMKVDHEERYKAYAERNSAQAEAKMLRGAYEDVLAKLAALRKARRRR